ncbi:adenosylmethionine decarboxylase [Microbispora triticiradicis]|uniref:Adenosylmethionine decarboxylase n=3 Tax=Microbispora TaxID=2005 RepID=A0ABY3LUZ0_9ACTN|nr:MULTISPECIES: adenosylmethionine decarboxylase [Microbispora]RGA04728.1 adenosylmethionine decarboxylase [Microbispora triticiradicis]TLP52377.1 adenosylmethionine decarboxylase [Microbispora fusca]TYB55457.1 adenosylmethionine decarboxylase [Microbispora tritici]GLW20619.1 S-adenosylmethionine decarboxylase proenzyme [Microbispora amethystogenes]
MSHASAGPLSSDEAAGIHILADLIGASRLDDPEHVEKVLRECVTAAGASLLYVYVHHFDRGEGVTGVAVLAESHISIHSWPEYRFAAIDIFMCGSAQPDKALPVLDAGFRPTEMVTRRFERGKGGLQGEIFESLDLLK